MNGVGNELDLNGFNFTTIPQGTTVEINITCERSDPKSIQVGLVKVFTSNEVDDELTTNVKQLSFRDLKFIGKQRENTIQLYLWDRKSVV